MSKQSEQSEQSEPIVSRQVYDAVRKKFNIMPDVLYAWLCGKSERFHNGLNEKQIMAAKMYLVAEFGENSGDAILAIQKGQSLHSPHDQQMIWDGWQLFTSWCGGSTVGLFGYGGALLRHITSPWKSPYARLNEDELEQTEKKVFDDWCNGMGVY